MSMVGARRAENDVMREGLVEPAELPAYGRLLFDVFHRDSALSIRDDEAEESWRVLTPVVAAWAKDGVPLEEYVAGSDGPVTR